MALGIGLPGLPNGKGPVFITGEPLREYHFQFRLTKPVSSKFNLPKWADILFSDLYLMYISGLANQFNPPNEEFQLGQLQVGTLQVPFPKGFTIPTFSVQYLEDELMSVTRFHMVWQQSIRGFVSGVARVDDASLKEGASGGMTFLELGKVCCGVIYAPSKKIPIPNPFEQFTSNLGLDDTTNKIISTSKSVLGNPSLSVPFEIPLGGEVFPYVFPTNISRGASSKEGQSIVKTTVTYSRIPDLREFNKHHHTPQKREAVRLENSSSQKLSREYGDRSQASREEAATASTSTPPIVDSGWGD